MRPIYRIPLLLLLTLWCMSHAHAADTLKFYNPKSKLVYYRDPGIVAQATRFEALKPLDITGIIITLGGDSARGAVSLRVFGAEGGLPVPLLQRDLARPIRIAKSRPGVQRIVVRLDEPIHVDAAQFFLVVDSISPGTLLLSDNQRKRPACTNGIEEFHHQFLRLRDGSWRSGVFAFAVEAIVEYTVKDPKGGFRDVTAEAGILDSLRFNASIAWADVDNDARLDLLVDGRLYHNDADGTFRDITEQAGISGSPLANAFIDIDSDARPDILFLGSADSTRPASLLFRNTGGAGFTRSELEIPRLANPTSFSIADADADGDLDLFVGQQSVRASDTLHNYLLMNDRGRGFIDRSRLLYGDSARRAASRGSQWIDQDGDGRLDLFVAGYDGADELWRSTGDSSYALADLGMREATAGGRRAGCDWADYDNDGDPDLLLPSSIPPARLLAASAERGGERRSVSLIMDNGGAPDHALQDRGAGSTIEYVDRHSGGTWGDVDNDGLLDAIITTGCDCRYVGLYRQRPDHRFEDRTTESGLRGVVAGPDAVWADWDNDGRLDLATVSGGRLRLYRNMGVGESGNWVELEVSGQGVGSVVTVHAGGERYTRQVTSGRGLLMGPPLRLHVGVGGTSRIDSVVVRPATGRAQTFTEIPVNAVSLLTPGVRRSDNGAGAPMLAARPNPFRTSVDIAYDLPAAGHVRLAIYSSIGRLVTVLFDGERSAGAHTVQWSAVDDGGGKQPHGTYILRLTTPAGEIEERIIRVD